MDLLHALERMKRKFERRAELDDADRAAHMALPFHAKTIEAGRYLLREGTLTTYSTLLLSGFAFRHKLTTEGERQIVSIHVPGDFIDLEGSLLRTADHNVQTLTPCKVATVGRDHIVNLIDSHPRVGRAMWIDTLVDGSIYREWVMNVGRRAARPRIGHILCEFGRRVELAGLGDADGYEFPMTQEQLADATGLTPVHVNRTLKSLEADGLIVRDRRFIGIPDWARLRDMAGFNELYLHLDQLA
jgi:CRP-like cAMP-binding protein